MKTGTQDPAARRRGKRHPSATPTADRPWPPRPTRRFFVRLALGLALVLAPWPGLAQLYRTVIAAGLNLLGDLTFPITFAFGPPATRADWQLLVHAQDAISGRVVDTTLDLRRTCYLASAVFLSLVFASPLGPRARLALLVRGLPLLTSLVTLPLLAFFSGPLPIRAFAVGEHLSAVLQLVYHILVAPPGMAYALPALLWLGLLWRQQGSSVPVPARARRGPIPGRCSPDSAR